MCLHIYTLPPYMAAGRKSEAQAAAKEIYRIKPDFSLDSWFKVAALKEGPELDRLLDLFRQAGLK